MEEDHRRKNGNADESHRELEKRNNKQNHIEDNKVQMADPRSDTQLSHVKSKKQIYKIVLTGGPCGGKTTGQSRLCTFFENLGWKVYRVPETATVLLSGGVKFSDLSDSEAYTFQTNLVRTMIQIENTYFELAKTSAKNCLVICDRGVMDGGAYIPSAKFEQMMKENNWNSIELRDNRYNQILHLVSAANGAEDFYTTEDHACRSEGVELARELDYKSAAAWVGHPYFDVIDNSTNFEAKMNRLIEAVCHRIGVDVGDRLLPTSKKYKFLVEYLPPDSAFPPFQDFDVVHHYLHSVEPVQARLRKRGQLKNFSFIHTMRRTNKDGSRIEVRTQLNCRDYKVLLAQRDPMHFPIRKKRRCFLINNQYFQLDIYTDTKHERCKGLILLETYSSLSGKALEKCLPPFLKIVDNVTDNPKYSMFQISLRNEPIKPEKPLTSTPGETPINKKIKFTNGVSIQKSVLNGHCKSSC